jgi:hypothetical protein
MANRNETVVTVVSLFAGRSMSDEEIDFMTRRLMFEMREASIPTEHSTRTDVVLGAKSGELEVLGTFLMHMMPTATPLMSSIFKCWLDKDINRVISLKLPNGIEFSIKGSMPLEDIERLVASMNTTQIADTPKS